MTSIVYEAEIDVEIDEVWVNGEPGGVRVYINEEAWDEGDELAAFENASAAYDFIDQLERALVGAGLRRTDDQ